MVYHPPNSTIGRNVGLHAGTKGLKRASFTKKSKPKSDYRSIARRYEKRLGTKKPVEGSRGELEKKLESLNATAVKMEHGYLCSQCEDEGVQLGTILDAGHIYPKGKFPSGKYLYENLIPQCRFHNTLHIRTPEILFTFYQKIHGENALIELHEKVLALPRKASGEWLLEQIAERERAVSEMEAHLCAMV